MCQLCENKQKLGEICLDCHKKLIMEEEKESRISTLEEVGNEIRLCIMDLRNDPSEGKDSRKREIFNDHLGFITQKLSSKIKELKQKVKT